MEKSGKYRPTKPQTIIEQTGQFYQSHTEAINVG